MWHVGSAPAYEPIEQEDAAEDGRWSSAPKEGKKISPKKVNLRVSVHQFIQKAKVHHGWNRKWIEFGMGLSDSYPKATEGYIM